MSCCLWIFYISSAVICFTCDIIVKVAAAHFPHRALKTKYTTSTGCVLDNRWKQTKPHFLQPTNESCFCAINYSGSKQWSTVKGAIIRMKTKCSGWLWTNFKVHTALTSSLKSLELFFSHWFLVIYIANGHV